MADQGRIFRGVFLLAGARLSVVSREKAVWQRETNSVRRGG